jgi:hypothetical protein
VERIRETPEKTSAETAYYLLSTALSPERFNQVVRQHWGVENRLHWRLDVGHERGSGSNQDGKRSAQSRRAQTPGSECDAKGRIERLNAREVQTRQLGRCLPDQNLGDVLKCDCPGEVTQETATRCAEAFMIPTLMFGTSLQIDHRIRQLALGGSPEGARVRRLRYSRVNE